MNIYTIDRKGYKLNSKRVYTDEGFLKVPAHVARSGVQTYLAYELGLDGDPMREVGVYRPAEEVFNPKSLATYKDADITDDHPDQFVDSVTYKDKSVGHVTSIGRKDNDHVLVDLIFKDKKSISKLEDGKVELSAGYTSEYVKKSGVFDGQPYEYIQTNIKINHVALVDLARAGHGAKVFDQKVESKNMLTLPNGATVEIKDANAAALIKSSFDTLQNKVKDAEETAEKEKEKSAKAEAEKDEANEKLEKEKEKSSDSAIAKQVELRASYCDAAKAYVKDFNAVGKTNDAIKLETCKSAFPKRDFTDRSAAYIDACFDQAIEQMADKQKQSKDQQAKFKDSANGLNNIMKDGNKNQFTDKRKENLAKRANAWKGDK